MVRIFSRKIEGRDGRRARHFAGGFAGAVIADGALVINLTDGGRSWHIAFDADETRAFVARLREISGL